ncbi:MAG: deoxyribose-phosphate aldolase [Bacteroidales bacterium]|nr:deoxyribose-phosphate aldolase [Bacteroidales bacterium]MBP5676858.1 deoxyribose-phosphate aldolase [Bacteroidales bacterium]
MSLSAKYGYAPDKEAIDRHLALIASNLEKVASEKVYKECFAIMDQTTLANEDTPASVAALVDKVNSFEKDYPDWPLPASICVYPNFGHIIAARRNNKALHVTTVAGCFPTSQSFLEVKLREIELAVRGGADEIDIVLALNSFLAGDYATAGEEIKASRECIDKVAAELGRPVVLKVILETGLLVTPELIADASFLAMENGADFIKTSTGKVKVNATPQAAYVMCQCIAKFHEATGRKVGFKAAGGIASALDAVCYYSIVNSILGPEWMNKQFFRFGVSSLANKLLSAVEQKTVAYF